MTALPLPVYGDAAPASGRFKQRLAAHGGELRAGAVTTLQVNLTGYGFGNGLVLNLVSNPVGAFLPPTCRSRA